MNNISLLKKTANDQSSIAIFHTMKKNKITTIFIVFITLLFAYRICSVVRKYFVTGTSENIAPRVQINPEYLKIEPQEAIVSIDALGQIIPYEKVNISSKVQGRLRKIYIREGTKVTRGQIIAEIERFSLELTLKEQEAELEIAIKSYDLAKAKYENALKAIEIKLAHIRKARAEVYDKKVAFENMTRALNNKAELFKVGGISESEYETFKTQHTTYHTRYLNAKADLEIQEVGFRDCDIIAAGYTLPSSEESKMELFKIINTKIEKAEMDAALSKINQVKQIIASTKKLIEETFIRSPIAGVAALKNMEVGEIVKNDSIIATIMDISKVFVSLNISETEAKLLKEGQHVTFTADAFGDEQFKGTIARITPVLDPKTRTFEIKAIVVNRDTKLLPGMFVRAKIIVEKNVNAILIPSEALISRNGTEGEVLLVKKNIALRQKITLGRELNGKIEVREGLSVGETIVSKSTQLLQSNESSRK